GIIMLPVGVVDGCHLGDVRLVGNGEERGGTGPLVRGPERAGVAVRNAPGVDEFGFGDRGQPWDVRNQINLNKVDDLGAQRTGAQSADGDPRHRKSLWEQISHLSDPPSLYGRIRPVIIR